MPSKVKFRLDDAGAFLAPIPLRRRATVNVSMSLVDLLFGRPLATEEEKAERIGPVTGIPIFGLDALSSAAYGPEAALTLLIPLGMAGVAYIVPISLSIIVLLGIVYFSYRQTITAYPQGGSSHCRAPQYSGNRRRLPGASDRVAGAQSGHLGTCRLLQFPGVQEPELR